MRKAFALDPEDLQWVAGGIDVDSGGLVSLYAVWREQYTA